MSVATACPRADGDVYRWTRLGSLPRRGWILVVVEDLEEPAHECEACGYPAVRYVHHLKHPRSGAELAVGCVCAEHLTGDYAVHREAERTLRNRQARIARLLDLDRWRVTQVGNRRIKYRRVRLVLYRSRFSDGWRINVGDRLGGRDHPTPEAAIRAAFRFVDPPTVTTRDRSSHDPRKDSTRCTISA